MRRSSLTGLSLFPQLWRGGAVRRTLTFLPKSHKQKGKRKEHFHEKHIFKSSHSCCFCRASKLFSTTLDPKGACYEIRDIVLVLDAPRIPEQSRGHTVRYCNACDWPGRDRERARLALGRELGHLSSRLLRLHRAGRSESGACASAGKIRAGEHSTRS